MTYYSPDELAASDIVEFETTDAKGKPLQFRTPQGAEVVVKGDPRPMVWNVQNGQGLSGATRRFGGVGLAEGSITLRMGGPEGAAQRAAFKAGMWRYFAPPEPGQNAKVFTVKHPVFAEYPGFPVLQIVPLEGPPGDWDKVSQLKTIEYKWGEWRKPLPTLTSAITAGNTKDGTKAKNDTKAALDLIVTQNTAEIGQLGAELAATP
jgi:hypothetical protein